MWVESYQTEYFVRLSGSAVQEGDGGSGLSGKEIELSKNQKLVAVGSISGAVFMFAALFLLSRLVTPSPGGMSAVAERLAFAAQWNAFAALPLVLAIASVGNERFRGPGIDPIAGASSRTLTINGRVIDNTVQQYALFTAASFAVAAGADASQLPIVSEAAILFVLLRLAFWIGYRINPLYRAFGMGGTLYLNLTLFAYAAWIA